uniref:Uncharacterized protein n=1 Tax=Arion vulgaris TaxID=1028688 RepID=A0A0B6XX47_9EUPU
MWHLMERHSRIWTLSCVVLITGVISAVAGFSIGDSTELITAYKRSAMDLAMMQVYRICDWDKNGVFTKMELQCVQRVISILFTGR